MKRAGWVVGGVGGLMALSACGGDAPHPDPAAIMGGIVMAECDGWPVHLFQDADQCFKRQAWDFMDFRPSPYVPPFQQYGVTGAHGAVHYDVSLYEAVGTGHFKPSDVSDMALWIRVTHAIMRMVIFAPAHQKGVLHEMGEPTSVGDIVYMTFAASAAAPHCFGFIRPGGSRDGGYAAFYTGQICLDGLDHAATADDVSGVVGLIKGKD